MRRISQLAVMCCAALLVTACSLDEVTETENIPTAGLRFINAVPDTQAVDFRFVDRVENSAHWNIAFRNNPVTTSCVTASTQIQYKNTRAGNRHFRIFLSDSIQAVASTVLKDSTTAFVADQRYTVLLWGRSRTGSSPAMRTTIIEDSPPDPGNQVALRVINASGGAIDVRHYLASGTVPAAAAWANVAPLSVTSYVLSAPGQIRINVRPAGGSVVLADALALPGAAGGAGVDPLPGTTMAGSAVTAIFFDPPVSGSKAPQGSAFRTTTGATILSATATGYERSSGSFLTDCFFVGGQITTSGFANPANNGTSIITAVTATSLTVTKTPSTVVERGTTGSTSLSATATGYARAAGSFVDDGFVVGQTINASGFTNPDNNGSSVITAISATDLTVTKTPPTVVEAAATGRTIASAAARTITTERLLSFVWDRRPPRN